MEVADDLADRLLDAEELVAEEVEDLERLVLVEPLHARVVGLEDVLGAVAASSSRRGGACDELGESRGLRGRARGTRGTCPRQRFDSRAARSSLISCSKEGAVHGRELLSARRDRCSGPGAAGPSRRRRRAWMRTRSSSCRRRSAASAHPTTMEQASCRMPTSANAGTRRGEVTGRMLGAWRDSDVAPVRAWRDVSLQLRHSRPPPHLDGPSNATGSPRHAKRDRGYRPWLVRCQVFVGDHDDVERRGCAAASTGRSGVVPGGIEPPLPT